MEEFDILVVGAGILGTTHAYFAGRRGLRTLLLERHDRPLGASVRNFGMIIPSGMPSGPWHQRAHESTQHYRSLTAEIGVPLGTEGTLYLATTPAERQVLKEFALLGPSQGYAASFLEPEAALQLCPSLVRAHCQGALHAKSDLRFEPQTFLNRFLEWLPQHLPCTYRSGRMVTGIREEETGVRLTTSLGETFRGRHVFLCSGSELRLLYPERLGALGLTHCKLQMMRLAAPGYSLGIPLASGLSLRRYEAFRVCPSWRDLAAEPVEGELLERGIHVLLCQDADGRLVLGDSHDYGSQDVDDRLDVRAEELILSQARRLVTLPRWDVVERWHGVYTQHPERPLIRERFSEHVTVCLGLGGRGMTLSPALAREDIDDVFGT